LAVAALVEAAWLAVGIPRGGGIWTTIVKSLALLR
jgi:hypothetical protein